MASKFDEEIQMDLEMESKKGQLYADVDKRTLKE
jgi:hypothetical protein